VHEKWFEGRFELQEVIGHAIAGEFWTVLGIE
jgi:hypothetical protein